MPPVAPLLLLLAGCGNALPARSLDDCDTSLDADAPAFFQLFRCVDATVDGDAVAVHTVDLPPHTTGYYDEDDGNWEEWDDGGVGRVHNPNTIREQDVTIEIPTDPVEKGLTVTEDMVDEEADTNDDEYPGGVGVGLDGTVFFDGMAAPGDDIEQEEISFDTWEAHPENTGTYHHHGANPAGLSVLDWQGLTTTDVPGSAEIEIYGIMCDGTVLLGCTELDGSAPDTSGLDAQLGHVHDMVASDGTTWFAGRYHVHMCEAFGRHLSPEIQYYEGECRMGP